jgi:uncharacterized protein with NAD-binding domain and iron-sulfur cluster
MAAAFELTRPEHRGRYQVTVYQLGWRLGGKGASGRGPADRIEEHGLHVWMGFYENALRLMRECYEELGRDPRTCPIATWRDAFAPAPFVGVADRMGDGSWVPWMEAFPPSEGRPGDALPDGRRWSVGDYFSRAVGLLRSLLTTLSFAGGPSPQPSGDGTTAGAAGVLDQVTRFLRYGELASLAALIEAVELLDTMSGGLAQYPRVQADARRAQERVVGGVAHERVLEGVALGAPAAPVEHEPALDQLPEIAAQRRLVLAGHRPQQLVRELSSEDGGHLRRLARARGEPVEAGGEQIAQRGGDVEARLAAGIGPHLGVAVGERARDLLDEERYALGAVDDLPEDRLREDGVVGE